MRIVKLFDATLANGRPALIRVFGSTAVEFSMASLAPEEVVAHRTWTAKDMAGDGSIVAAYVEKLNLNIRARELKSKITEAIYDYVIDGSVPDEEKLSVFSDELYAEAIAVRVQLWGFDATKKDAAFPAISPELLAALK